MTTPDTPPALNLDALRALEQAATPAPWVQEYKDSDIIHGPDGTVAETTYEPANAEFIAAVRNQLPALLSALATVTAERDEARQFQARVWQRIQAWNDDPQTRLEAFAITHEHLDAAHRDAEQARAELDAIRADRDHMHRRLSNPVVRAVAELAEDRDHQFRRAEAAHDAKDEANRRWLAATTAAVPKADEPSYTGIIGYDERVDRWTMTCSEHGEIYRSTDGTADAHDECIRAWQSHCTTVHGEEAEVDGSDWLVPHAREEFRREPLPTAAPDPAACIADDPDHVGMTCDEYDAALDAAPGPANIRTALGDDWSGLFNDEAKPVPAGGEDGSGTADGEVPA